MILSCRPVLAHRVPARNKKKKALYKNCKNCGSANILSSGPDQLCCDCDWHTCFEYVDRGYMNNLQYAYSEHFPKQSSVKSKDIQLSEYNKLGDSKVVETAKIKSGSANSNKQRSA